MDEKSRTELIVDELKRLKGLGKGAVVEEEQRKFVIFTLHDGFYAFAGEDVKEILPSLELFPVPGAPRDVPGLINNRGDIEAVIDLHGVLGLPGGVRAASNRIAITEKAGVRSGMLLDSVLDVVDVPSSAIKPPLATLDAASREVVAGEMLYQGRNVVLLDVRRILERLRDHGR